MTKDATTRDTSGKNVGAVVSAIQILRHLVRADGPRDVAAVARATGISPSSAFNILRTLSNKQLASFDDTGKTYQLDLGLSEFAVGFVGRSYAGLIQPELERLSLTHHILIVLRQITNDAHIRIITLAAPPAAHASVAIGTRLPELTDAAGRCITGLRELPEDKLHRRLAHVRWENPSGFERYQTEAAKVVEHGRAIDQEHFCRDVSIIASAITGRDGQPCFAISAIGIGAQHQPDDLERIGTSLRDTAHFVSHALFPRGEALKERS